MTTKQKGWIVGLVVGVSIIAIFIRWASSYTTVEVECATDPYQVVLDIHEAGEGNVIVPALGTCETTWIVNSKLPGTWIDVDGWVEIEMAYVDGTTRRFWMGPGEPTPPPENGIYKEVVKVRFFNNGERTQGEDVTVMFRVKYRR